MSRWRRLVEAFQPAEMRDTRREITALQVRNGALYRSLVDARALQVAAEEAVGRHAAKLRAIADVLADQSLSTAAANQRVRQILMEDGPVSGGVQQ